MLSPPTAQLLSQLCVYATWAVVIVIATCVVLAWTEKGELPKLPSLRYAPTSCAVMTMLAAQQLQLPLAYTTFHQALYFSNTGCTVICIHTRFMPQARLVRSTQATSQPAVVMLHVLSCMCSAL